MLAHTFLLLLVATHVHCLTPDAWMGRRIYQILTDRFANPSGASCPDLSDYCGGTFQGVINQLSYIQGMGFDAIWISPIPVNFPKGYHGYWATDFFKVNPHFGTATDLTAMVTAIHNANMVVMIDIVTNHVGPVGTDFTTVSPFNDSSHYHPECQVTDYTCMTTEVQHCRLANLPDLNQDVPFVNQQLLNYVQWLIGDFGFDGIRADTVMYIKPSFWVNFKSTAGVYIVGEVWSDFSCQQQYVDQNAIDATLDYDTFYVLRNVFQSGGSMTQIGSNWRQLRGLPNPKYEVNFIDNQDNTRWLFTSSSIPAYKSALTHMFFMDGIPCVYYGTEQYFNGGNDPNCREPLWPTNYATTDMYNFIATLSAAHAKFTPWTYEYEERWQDASFYCFLKGLLLVCTTNSMSVQNRTIPTLPFAGYQVCDYLDSSYCLTGASTMTISLNGGMPRLLFAQSSRRRHV